MAIAFNCPHCQFSYRLPDTYAGKAAKCKNPECRQLITIPTPITIPDDGPKLSQEEIDAAALAALGDEPAKVDTTPVEEKVIPVTCKFCDHKWTVPWSMAGKNTLCPNQECRQRVKVDEPKEDVPTDWRQAKSKLPTLAKQNFEKPTDVQDAGDAKIVSGKALVEAGATGIEIEPRTLKEKLFIVFGIVGVVALIGGSIWFFMSRRTTVNEEQLMADATKEFEKEKAQLNPPDAAMSSAVLNLAAAEYALRHDAAKKLKEGHDLFAKARNEIRIQPPSPARNAMAAELALAVLAFGGTDEQAKEQIRFRWQPDTETGRNIKMSERVHTIFEELRQTLGILQATDFDFRISVARRLTRALAQHKQAGMAADLLPSVLFTEPEKDEARAVIGLELHRSKETEAAKRIAEELKTKFESELKAKGGLLRGNPYPVSAQTLFVVLGTDKAPAVVAAPAGNDPTDISRLAYVGIRLLEDKPDDARNLAVLGAAPQRVRDAHLKALVLCADWSADPTAALASAQELLNAVKGRKDVTVSPYHTLRLVQIAAERGKHAEAAALAEFITDEGLKAWALGEAVRYRVAGSPKEKADEAWLELPLDMKLLKAGHVWGRLWIARQNAKLSHNRDAEKKATANWPPAAHPFALAGIALGLQDK